MNAEEFTGLGLATIHLSKQFVRLALHLTNNLLVQLVEDDLTDVV